MVALRALAIAVLVGLVSQLGTGPLSLWLHRQYRAAPPRTSWKTTLWITGSGIEPPAHSSLAVLEAAAPALVVWCEPEPPPAGPKRLLWDHQAPPGGGQLLGPLSRWRGSLTETTVGATGRSMPEATWLFRPPLVDFRYEPGEMTASLAAQNPDTVAGRVLVLGAAENLNGPPTPRGPMPTSKAVALGTMAALEGHLIWPVRAGWLALLSGLLALGFWRQVRAGPVPRPRWLQAFVAVGVLSAGLFLAGGWLLEPTPLWVGLAAAAVFAPGPSARDDRAALGRGLARLQDTGDLEAAVLAIPGSLRESRRGLYTSLQRGEAPLPRPLGRFESFELTALAAVLEARDRPVLERLEVLEWALLAAPDDPQVADAFEAAQEEAQTEVALLDLESLLGDLAPRFQDAKLLGQGAMGLVVEARDVALDRLVAVKLVNPAMLQDADTTDRFWREIEALSSLIHPHIVQIFGAYPGRVPYYSMEHLPGETLQAALVRGALGPDARRQALLDLADALDHLHERGFVHRDLKPENMVLVSRQGGGVAESWDAADLRLVVIDFGVARGGRSKPLTQAGDVLGTMAYMAPEQLRGEPVAASADRFAFAVVAWEVLTGSRPYKNAYQMTQLVAPRLRSVLPRAPLALEAELAQLMAANPEVRPPSLAGIRDLLAGESFF